MTQVLAFTVPGTVEQWHLVVDIIAAVAVVGGFILAIRELRRGTEASVEAAREARETRLLSVLQELREVEDRLYISARDNDRPTAERATRDWSNLASDAHALLSDRDSADAQLLESIKDSLTVASRTKTELYTGNPSVPVGDTTAKLIEVVGPICNGVGLIGSTISAQRVERSRS